MIDKKVIIEKCNESYNAYCDGRMCHNCKYSNYDQDCKMVYGIEYTLEEVGKELLRIKG